ELTRAEYEELSLKSEARSTKLETISNEQKPNDKNKDVLNLKHSSFGFVSDFDIRDSKLGELYRSAMSFYQMAIVREEKMFQNALTRMSSQKQQRAVIVTGGFHADGLKKLATSKNCSYIQITPRINEVSKRDHEVYLRSILGSRDVETSQMSALLGIVDRAQRVTVTGIAATKGWARDVRGLILGMINSENVSDRPGLNLAFSSSIFGSATSSLAPVIARAEVRLPTGDETTAFTNLINQFQIVWDNHPTAVTVGIGVLLSLIGIVAVKYIKHTRNVVELRRQNPILDLIMKKAPKISSKKALELVLEAKSVFDAKGDFEVFFHEATKEYQQNVGEPKQEHLSNGGYVEYYDTETIPATPAYWYIAAPSNVRSEVRLTLAQEKQFTQTTAISQQTTAKIAVTAHFSGVAKKLMLAAVVGMMSVSAKAADVVAPAANDVATAEARSQSEVAKGDAFQIAIDNLLKSPDIYGAAIALLQLKDPRTVPALLELLKDKNQRVRGRAINVLAEFRDDPRVADALRSAASDEDGFVKWVATGTPKDIEKPQGAVNSSSGLSARDAALFAMLRDPLKDEDPNMKSKIELYLKEGGVQDPDAADLFRIITAVKPVLNQFNSDPGLSAFFIKVLTDKKESGRVLQTAILILGVLEENGATPALLPYLKDENIKTRMAVVSTLQNLNDRRVIPEAIRVLKEDPVAKIRMQSIGVLRLYSDARVMSALREASLKDPNEDVRKMARYTVKIIEKFQKKQNTAPSAPRSELRVDLVQIASIVFFVITYLLSGHELRQVKAFVNGDESRYGNYREVLAQRLAQSKGIENPTEEQLLAGAVWAAPQAPAFFAFLAGGFGALYLSLTWGEVFLSAALSSIVVHSMVKFGALTLVKNRNSGQGPEDSNISDSDSRSEVRLTAA
ncbi:MAG: HEAT repeat domain-containing protein, partial [Candidatus Omnitrophota bacterium]